MKRAARCLNLLLGRFYPYRLTAKQDKSGQTEQQLNGAENSKCRSKAERNRSAEDHAAHAESCKEDEDIQPRRDDLEMKDLLFNVRYLVADFHTLRKRAEFSVTVGAV